MTSSRPFSREYFETTFYGGFSEFSCRTGCTACCKGVLSLSIPELLIIREEARDFEPAASGCPFRGPDGCRVYPVRPFMCRLFGFQYLHPELAGQPFCPKATRLRPGDLEAEGFRQYQRFCEEQGFVIVGEPHDASLARRYIRENRAMVKRFPELVQFRKIISGRERCWEEHVRHPSE